MARDGGLSLRLKDRTMMTVAPRAFTVEECEGTLLVSRVQIP